MAKKSNKKIFYAALVLLVLIIAGVFLYIQKTSNPALSSCIKEWKAKNLKPTEYATGAIFVQFNPTVTEQQASQLIQKNGLLILRSYLTEDYPTKNKTVFNAEIEVPINSEFKWACKFQIHTMVNTASVLFK